VAGQAGGGAADYTSVPRWAILGINLHLPFPSQVPTWPLQPIPEGISLARSSTSVGEIGSCCPPRRRTFFGTGLSRGEKTR